MFIKTVWFCHRNPFQEYIKSGNGDATKFRLVVKRKPRKDMQLDLLTQDAYEYRVILINDLDKAPREVAAFYNQRGNMERQFDILKNDFGWNNMSFSSMNKKPAFLYFTAIYRNLYNKVIRYFSGKHDFLAPTDRMKKFLFRFIALPAKWVEQGRGVKLRVYSVKDYQT